MNDRFAHLLRKSRDAKQGNRADWLAEIGYTLPEAIERSGAEWVAVIPQIARQLVEEE
jgi:hypothetical protein